MPLNFLLRWKKWGRGFYFIQKLCLICLKLHYNAKRICSPALHHTPYQTPGIKNGRSLHFKCESRQVSEYFWQYCICPLWLHHDCSVQSCTSLLHGYITLFFLNSLNLVFSFSCEINRHCFPSCCLATANCACRSKRCWTFLSSCSRLRMEHLTSVSCPSLLSGWWVPCVPPAEMRTLIS